MSSERRVEIPESTTIERDGEILEWTNASFQISVEEAEVIADEIRQYITQDDVTGILVDNTEARGAWDPEVNDVWTDLMGEFYEEDVKSATICPSKTNSVQINRLSRDAGTDDKIQAFDDPEPAREFLGLE